MIIFSVIFNNDFIDRICGSLESVPPFTWMVDQSQTPEEVNIVMKNIGLNDGQSEGLGFSVSGNFNNQFKKNNHFRHFNELNNNLSYNQLKGSRRG